MLRILLCFLMFFATLNFVDAQIEKYNIWSLHSGLVASQTKETHYTSSFRSGIGYYAQLGFEKRTTKVTHRFCASFLQAAQGKENPSYSNLLNPEFRFTLLKDTNKNGIHIGGYFDAGALLNFRRGLWADENSINYTIWSTLGFVVGYEKNISLNNKQLQWNTSFSLPILGYLIRPSYTFPYPDNYLENDVFNFDRSGLGGKIVSGGELVTLNKFINFEFKTGVTLPAKNKKWTLGLDYTFNYRQTNELKPLFQSIHSLSLVVKFLKQK